MFVCQIKELRIKETQNTKDFFFWLITDGWLASHVMEEVLRSSGYSLGRGSRACLAVRILRYKKENGLRAVFGQRLN